MLRVQDACRCRQAGVIKFRVCLSRLQISFYLFNFRVFCVFRGKEFSRGDVGTATSELL